MFFKYLPFNVSERVKVNEVMQELTKYLNVTITNQEMSQVKALKFDEKKISSYSIPDNDGTHACFYLSFDIIN